MTDEESLPLNTVFKKKELDQAIQQAKDESKHDHDYRFISDQSSLNELVPSKNINRICAFCNRKEEPLVGPFCKFDEGKDSQRLVGQPLFFHQECLEINPISKYSPKEKTWVNIGHAL
jgi:hypothetical protein